MQVTAHPGVVKRQREGEIMNGQHSPVGLRKSKCSWTSSSMIFYIVQKVVIDGGFFEISSEFPELV